MERSSYRHGPPSIKAVFVLEFGDALHCVEPVPRSDGVPMARFEPVQTAWAMSKPPSMAMEAREIVEYLIVACGNRTHLIVIEHT